MGCKSVDPSSKERNKKRKETSSSSSSSSEEEEECNPCTTTQIFIGSPVPGLGGCPATCPPSGCGCPATCPPSGCGCPATCPPSEGVGKRDITQEEWCSKYCENGHRKPSSRCQEASVELGDGETGKDKDGVGGNKDRPTMTQEEWCKKYCVNGRPRRFGDSPQSRRKPPQQPPKPECLPFEQPQVVCLPALSCCGGCSRGKGRGHGGNCCCNPGDGDKTSKGKKTKKGEEPMTPAQQYLTFLQGYALAAAVMIGGAPPVCKPRPRQIQSYQQCQPQPQQCQPQKWQPQQCQPQQCQPPQCQPQQHQRRPQQWQPQQWQTQQQQTQQRQHQPQKGQGCRVCPNS